MIRAHPFGEKYLQAARAGCQLLVMFNRQQSVVRSQLTLVQANL